MMITTGIHIPNAILAKLASAIAGLHRETANMTMADWRKAYRERSGATLGCFIYVDFTASGTVKGFEARQIEKTREKYRERGFETDVPMLGLSRYTAKLLARDFSEFLLQREVTQRNKANQRELVGLTDDELSSAADELAPFKNSYVAKSMTCGALSEQLRLRLIEDEIAIRGKESNHQRLKAIDDNKEYLAACIEQVEKQRAAAHAWHAREHASSFHAKMVEQDFANRSPADQTLIAYRDSKGWRV